MHIQEDVNKGKRTGNWKRSHEIGKIKIKEALREESKGQ